MKGGSGVSPDHKTERINECRLCPHIGQVQVRFLGQSLPFDEGCTLCGCPLDSKAGMDTIMREPDSLDRSVSPSELIKSLITNKQYVPQKVRCTDYKNGIDRWKAIDRKHNPLQD